MMITTYKVIERIGSRNDVRLYGQRIEVCDKFYIGHSFCYQCLCVRIGVGELSSHIISMSEYLREEGESLFNNEQTRVKRTREKNHIDELICTYRMKSMSNICTIGCKNPVPK